MRAITAALISVKPTEDGFREGDIQRLVARGASIVTT